MLRIPLIALFIFGLALAANAQDSVKKAAVPAKPYSKYKIYKYHTYRYHGAKTDSVNGKPIVRQALPVKPDSAALRPAFFDKSLNGQYQTLLPNIYHYQQPLLATFWKNVLDTLKLSKSSLKEVKSQLSQQNKTIDSLKADVTTLTAANEKVGGVSLFGLFLSQGAYNAIVWGLIIVLGLIAVIAVMRSGSNSREAKYRTKLYSELEDEFKAYKTKANDKEKKLARELQTERNKLDDLLGK